MRVDGWAYSGVDTPGKYEHPEDGHDLEVNGAAVVASNWWELRPHGGTTGVRAGDPGRGRRALRQPGRGRSSDERPARRTLGDGSPVRRPRSPGARRGRGPGRSAARAGPGARDTMEPVSSSGTTRAVFRVSPLVVLFALALAFCATPVAFGAPFLWLIYLCRSGSSCGRCARAPSSTPAGCASDGSSAGAAWRGTTSPAAPRPPGPVRAVLAADGELALPAVHVRDLPALALPAPAGCPTPPARDRSERDTSSPAAATRARSEGSRRVR